MSKWERKQTDKKKKTLQKLFNMVNNNKLSNSGNKLSLKINSAFSNTPKPFIYILMGNKMLF